MVIAMAKGKRWIQKAVKHRGALKNWLKKEHPELLKRMVRLHLRNYVNFMKNMRMN